LRTSICRGSVGGGGRVALGRGDGVRVGVGGRLVVAVRAGVGARVGVGPAVGRRVGVPAGDGADVLVVVVGRGPRVAVDAPGGVAEMGRSRCRISVTPNAITATIAPISTNSTASSGERRPGAGGGPAGQTFHPGDGAEGYAT
jgi:hypothetical protein